VSLCRSGDHTIADHRDRAANGGCRKCQQRRQRELWPNAAQQGGSFEKTCSLCESN